MSKLLEYIKLIPKGIKNIPQIIEGIRNQVKFEHGSLPEEDIEIIVGRRLICNSCPFLSINAIKSGVYATDRNDVHCTGCGCPISIRTASLESNCGLEDYNEEHPNSPLPLKWHKVK